MTGSGNDFVFFDARIEAPGILESGPAIDAICDRRMGVGADGVVFLETGHGSAFSIRYYNRDGTLAELCGNASLCSVSLARELGIVQGDEDFSFGTTSGFLRGRSTEAGPRIEMPPVREAQSDFATKRDAGETRVGYARVGVPHLVVMCADVEHVDVERRGRELRNLPSLPEGANANFLSRRGEGWTYRTYERGVEAETLACGTGSVAAAALLRDWGLVTSPVRLLTRSGAPLEVLLDADGRPTLSGEGRLVFEGELRTVIPAWPQLAQPPG